MTNLSEQDREALRAHDRADALEDAETGPGDAQEAAEEPGTPATDQEVI